MADPTDAEFAAAEERGRIAMVTEPRAKTARYDAATDRVIVELFNGCTFMFPPRLVQGLEDASEAEIAKVETTPVGFGLHWEASDVDITVAGLMAGRFGTARYMVERFGPGWNAVAAE
ncbi:DUF2442 domain-containing protein [Sphingomonas sp. S1-29]|uniref:DUF2442 domain-containing protein n=1 Tax=Sphingomonas sp. S1-29 TaxID=2991074 RepID=UPI00224067FB|nr:DUF2442 domain-containing protein [Sphingomonas sp. S1-29]UZK68387.1 DUF2442 domain-containing protein [Sphingomonas sp. S1-29]